MGSDYKLNRLGHISRWSVANDRIYFPYSPRMFQKSQQRNLTKNLKKTFKKFLKKFEKNFFEKIWKKFFEKNF